MKTPHQFFALFYSLGGHRVSAGYGIEIFINVCRDITFGTQVPAGDCSDDPKKLQPRPACRKDIKKAIGKITSTSKLYYDGEKIKLVYATEKTAECPEGVKTDITFLCEEQFSNVSILKRGSNVCSVPKKSCCGLCLNYLKKISQMRVLVYSAATLNYQ
jgi:hypothetical protein